MANKVGMTDNTFARCVRDGNVLRRFRIRIEYAKARSVYYLPGQHCLVWCNEIDGTGFYVECDGCDASPTALAAFKRFIEKGDSVV